MRENKNYVAKSMASPKPIKWVMIALIPGSTATIIFFGTGYLWNIAIATCISLILEGGCLVASRKRLSELHDGGFLITAIIIGLSLPPDIAPAIVITAVGGAILIGRLLYGGERNHLFNPAMVGYVIVLISFPETVSSWPAPVDGLTNATALVSMKYREGLTVLEAWNVLNGLGTIGGYGWEWINLCFLIGGILLILKKMISWQTPLSIIGTITLLSIANFDSGSMDSKGPPLFHLFAGSTMLLAFFVASDPTTQPIHNRDKAILGMVIGSITFFVRGWGNYPDGAAFAVLLGNAITPYLNSRRIKFNAKS